MNISDLFFHSQIFMQICAVIGFLCLAIIAFFILFTIIVFIFPPYSDEYEGDKGHNNLRNMYKKKKKK